MRPDSGKMLGGRYRLDRQIAVGGMGEVWTAHDDSLNREVAIKVLREEFAGDASFLARFRTEARNAGSLSHPGIAALYDYGEQDGSAFLAMELIEGDPLSDLLEREPVMAPRKLLPILSQAARALHAAHLAGVVHRDVKPGNIMVTPTGRVKLTDFGVSMANNQVPMTATGMVMGTAQYLSPEQAVGGPASAASDMYALGIIAYEATVGHRPFTGASAVDIAVAHVNTPVPPLPHAVDPALARLIMRLLSKDPVDRPSSADELADLMDALVPHTPPEGNPQAPARVSRPAAIPVAGRQRTVSSRGRPAEAGATRVPGSGGQVDDRRFLANLPSFDPRTGRPVAEPAAEPEWSRLRPEPAAHARNRGVWWVRWLLFALVVLLVVVLGAALADRVIGTLPVFPREPGVVVYHDQGTATSDTLLASAENDMICGRPCASAPDDRTTTVKDT